MWLRGNAIHAWLFRHKTTGYSTASNTHQSHEKMRQSYKSNDVFILIDAHVSVELVDVIRTLHESVTHLFPNTKHNFRELVVFRSGIDPHLVEALQRTLVDLFEGKLFVLEQVAEAEVDRLLILAELAVPRAVQVQDSQERICQVDARDCERKVILGSHMLHLDHALDDARLDAHEIEQVLQRKHTSSAKVRCRIHALEANCLPLGRAEQFSRGEGLTEDGNTEGVELRHMALIIAVELDGSLISDLSDMFALFVCDFDGGERVAGGLEIRQEE